MGEEVKREHRGRRKMEETGKRRRASDRWRDGEGRIYCKRQMSKMAGRRGGGDGRGQEGREED